MEVSVGFDRGWIITDPGNHVATQPKLWHYFDDMPVIIFTAPISEYDVKTSSDGNTQDFSLMELVPQFRAVCEAPEFSKAFIILLMTKLDLFKEKLVTDPLENHFPEYRQSDYPWTHDNWPEYTFLQDLFKHGNSRERIAYRYVPGHIDLKSRMGFVLTFVQDGNFTSHSFPTRK